MRILLHGHQMTPAIVGDLSELMHGDGQITSDIGPLLEQHGHHDDAGQAGSDTQGDGRGGQNVRFRRHIF
jgi:hypothetical protein